MRKIKGLYGITRDGDPDVEKHVQAALEGGARLIQFRNKSIRRGLDLLAENLAGLCVRYDALLIVNDDVDLAVAVNADGVHLGKNDSHIAAARRKIGDKIIGVSCYNKLELAIEAERQGADYVAFGRFFSSETKPHARLAELDLLTLARQRLSVPIVAIGGITTQNAAMLVQSGADSIAVINGLFQQPDIKKTAQMFSKLF